MGMKRHKGKEAPGGGVGFREGRAAPARGFLPFHGPNLESLASDGLN